MRWQLQRMGIAFSFIVILSEFCTSNNDTRTSNHNKIVKKLKKDFRKLKKEEGALKLTGGENGDHEGNVNYNSISLENILQKIYV